MTHTREHDIVLFGASGFVGRLVAAHLATHAPGDLRVALAGRSRQRLSAVREGLGGPAGSWPVVEADAGDEQGLGQLARASRVIATTVGPYARHGLPLVRACAAAGTDYADLTGEVAFVRASIDGAHQLARDSGARIVHACGFDSVPSDLAVLALADRAHADGAGELTTTTYALTDARGAVSGGTVDSLRGQLAAMASDPAVRALVADPYALSPDRAREPDLGETGGLSRPRRDPDTGEWFAPFVMAPFNTRIVRRSNALRGWSYGRSFRYDEVVSCGRGRLSPVVAAGVTGATAAAGALLRAPVLRPLTDRLLPSPGDGPTEVARARGRFRIRTRTRTTGGATYESVVAATGDPGYAATAAMLGESALCLALAERTGAGGVLTPATALGHGLADRLRAVGFHLDTRPA